MEGKASAVEEFHRYSNKAEQPSDSNDAITTTRPTNPVDKNAHESCREERGNSKSYFLVSMSRRNSMT